MTSDLFLASTQQLLSIANVLSSVDIRLRTHLFGLLDVRPQKLSLDLINLDMQVLSSLAAVHPVSVLFHFGFESWHVVAASLQLAFGDLESDVCLVVAVTQLIKLSATQEPLPVSKLLGGR